MVRFLEDGNWHTFAEVRRDLRLSETELRRAVDFLMRFGFIEVDVEGERVKLCSSFLELPV